MQKKINNIVVIFAAIIVFLSIWIRLNFGGLKIEEMLFLALTKNSTGNMEIVVKFFLDLSIFIFIISLFFIFNRKLKNELVLRISYKKKNIKFTLFPIYFDSIKKIIQKKHISLIIMVTSLLFFSLTFDVFAFIKNRFSYSNLYETKYVEPLSVKLSFPEKKRNLIYIYMESMDTNFYEYNEGNLIPNLNKIAEKIIIPLKFTLNKKRQIC